jgi:hypothetical protein
VQIKWKSRHSGSTGNVCLVTVDGTDFRIPEPSPFWTGWFSHKFKAAGLRYEIAICIKTGYIVWVNGPFPCGSFPDIKIFRSALKYKLRAGEKVEADNGYRGEPLHVSLPGDIESELHKKAEVAARARHETVNKRFKQFKCLKDVFRHDISKHAAVFRAVAVLTQLSMENGDPAFQVY